MEHPALASAKIFSVGQEATVFGMVADRYFAELVDRPGIDIWGHVHSFMSVARHLAPDATILDIGANIGLTVLAGSRLVPQGRVIALEPSPMALEALYRMVAENGLPGVEIVPKCIGASQGTVSFMQDANFLAGSYVGSNAREGAFVEVEMLTLDQLTAQMQPKSIDLIKIDVEGFELDVLEGGLNTIAQYNPTFIVEYNSFAMTANRNASPRSLLDFVIDRFGSFKVIRSGQISTITTPAEVRDFIYSNMVMCSCIDDIIFGRDVEIDLFPY